MPYHRFVAREQMHTRAEVFCSLILKNKGLYKLTNTSGFQFLCHVKTEAPQSYYLDSECIGH